MSEKKNFQRHKVCKSSIMGYSTAAVTNPLYVHEQRRQRTPNQAHANVVKEGVCGNDIYMDGNLHDSNKTAA